MKIDINTDACVVMTNKLEQLHKSAFPSAVRGTLNRAAFDVKTNTLLKTVDEEFEKRQPNFFRAFSKVQVATGFNLSTMQAIIGMTPQGLKGGNNHAVDDLQQQEHGGTIGGRNFIPLNTARIGNSNSRNVKPGNRISNIKNVVSAKNNRSKNVKGRFLRSVFAANSGGYVLSERLKGRQILWRIDSISSNARHRNLVIKKTALYTYDETRDVKIQATGFMEHASLESAHKIERFYNEEGKRQIERLMSK